MEECEIWGLNVNTKKSEHQTNQLEDEETLKIKNEEIKKVNKFKY